MSSGYEPRRGLPADLAGALESPFLDSKLFEGEVEPGQEARLAALEAENAFRLAFEGYAREGVERLALPKGTDGERIEYEIIGTNDMDAVANSLAVPYRWICRLDINYDITPFGTSRRLTGTGRGTGTLISPCHVLTAAHNLIDYDPLGRNTLRATRIRVTPVHDGSSSPPVAMVEAVLSQSPTHHLWDITRRYDSTGAANNAGEVETNRYDYALLRLRTAIGDSQVAALGGPLGYWGTKGSGGAARFQRVEPVVLRSNTVFVAGYGIDECVRAARTARSNSNIPLGSQLTATGQITLVMEGRGTQYVGRSMAHDVDTCSGQSGAPVCLELNGIYCLVGVHTGGVALTSGSRTNHSVRVTIEVSNQVRDWMTRAPCPGAARELEVDGSLAGESLAFEEEDLAPDGFDLGGGEQELNEGPAGEEPAEWATEWAGGEGASPLTTAFNQPWGPAGTEEPEGEAALEYDTPPMTQAISDAVDQKDWPRVLELAMQVGWHDENQLTNLLFFSRHTELDRRKLEPKKNKEDRKLAQEWSQILVKEVRPAIQKAAEDSNLEVSGRFVAERDPQLSGEKGEKFKEVVARAAKDVDMDPGFLAAVLLAEVGSASPYLSPGEVSSFFTGADDFFEQRAQLRANVPAFAQVNFDERKKTTNINEHGRQVTTIPYKTGRDAALATAVYLKHGEIKLRRAAQKNGGDFDTLPVATRFVLVRIAMAAGHGGISPDGDLIRFKKKGGKWVRAKPGETGGILLGAALSLDRVLKGEDILVRNWEPRKDPTNDSHITHRNATILSSQAMHLGDWFFRAPPLGIQPELEESEGSPDLEEDAADDEAADVELEDEVVFGPERDEDESAPFEALVPEVSLSDLRTRIDDYSDMANAEYTLPNDKKVKALPQFRYATAGGTEAAIDRLHKILGAGFEKSHPRAIRYAAYGRAKPSQIAAITQALIDAGELSAVSSDNPGLADNELVRKLQGKFKVGIDCAGYVQLAFVYAFLGHDNDTPTVRRKLGLHERRGYERLSDLPVRHFEKVAVTDARTGDLFVLKPRAGDADRAWHTVIVVDHTVDKSIHTFLVDASWGTDLYGEIAGGVARRQLVHDTDTGKWWDISPVYVPLDRAPCGIRSVKKGEKTCENAIGPYAGHTIKGVYRGKQK